MQKHAGKWQRCAICRAYSFVSWLKTQTVILEPGLHSVRLWLSIMQINVATHIENRRLFEAAAGSLRLQEWERSHLHACKVCQGVFYVFISQPIRNPLLNVQNPEGPQP